MTAIGAHVSRQRPLEAARDLGADCVQIFLSDPGSYRKPPPHPEAEAIRASPIGVYVHAPYLINVCSPKPNVRYGSRKILQQTCDAASDVGADGRDRSRRPRRGRPGRGTWPVAALARAAGDRRPRADREHGRGRERRRAPLRCPGEAVGRDRRRRDRSRPRLLLRHLSRPRRGRGAERGDRTSAGDHGRDRPRTRQRLTRPGRHRRRSPRATR